ncbi:TetR/AcrR family transcriptional regulator [Saccharothrix coeruleofusca]|uniref:TetR family transcriptional regulator n=1 Tax=Saccharothrix coeruleofusca TaxID=33919 RepID=A0A918AMH6_9PSEU|nr:TetR/AcrR family transcriptional regulator [Saccharothrix coeruleofusca]MBP2339280.1 AcrR family transcriptional regulator [Saccharothrix coeruleofusca]GGP58894.1 TetR family transcriptional regulator [Saccharothrix coeruleofusca]
MTRNPARRISLVNAAIEVLARDGARGLTFRAVDAEAGVPTGTASNYFANRDDLLRQVGEHIHVRFTPDPAKVADTMRAPADRGLLVTLMKDLLDRLRKDRAAYLALLELRLEATRRPELQAALTKTISDTLEDNVRFHVDYGLPGDRTTVVSLYLAMSGLVVEHLTLPEVLPESSLEGLVEALVDRTQASAGGAGGGTGKEVVREP